MTRYQDYIGRKSKEHGDKFCTDYLWPEFVPYFNSGERVRISTEYGRVMTGTIGITTGWRPCFLLMRRSSDMGSSYTLTSGDQIMAVQHGWKYVAV